MNYIMLFESFKKWSNDAILNEFINEIASNNKLQLNPLNNSELILNDEAVIELDRFDKQNRREISLSDISVLDKGKGIGNKSMKILTDAADKLKITLTLFAKPFGKNGLSKKDLIAFYKKHGFETVKGQYGINSIKKIEDYVFSEESEGLDMIRKNI